MQSALIWLFTQLMGLMLFFQGYQSSWIPTQDGQVHVLQAQGQGALPGVVLLHGLGSEAADLYPVFSRLRPHTQELLILDFPGHGRSHYASDGLDVTQLNSNFEQALNQVLAQREPVILWGNSLGGWQALQYAIHHPTRVKALILVSPGGAQTTPEQYQDLKRIFNQEVIHTPEKMIPRIFNQPPLAAGLVAYALQGRYKQPGVRSLVLHFEQKNALQPENLQKLTMPVLLIWGQQDRILEGQLPFFKAHLPEHTTFVEPEHFTHGPYLEGDMAEDLHREMLGWLMGE